MVELSEVIFDIEVQLEKAKTKLAAVDEVLRLDSIRTSTARRFTVSGTAVQAGRERPQLEATVQALQLQLNNALIKLPISIEEIEIPSIELPPPNLTNIGILALIVVGAIVVLR